MYFHFHFVLIIDKPLKIFHSKCCSFTANLKSLRSLRYCFVPREHKLELSKWIYLGSLAKQIEIVNQLWVQTAPQKKPKKKQVLQLRNCTEFPQNVYILLDSCKCVCVCVLVCYLLDASKLWLFLGPVCYAPHGSARFGPRRHTGRPTP